MTKLRALSILIFATTMIACGSAAAGGGGESEGPDWPRWRGPDGNGVTVDSSFRPHKLGSKTKIAWQVDVGAGFSSPSIRGDRLYTMGNAGGADSVYCLDAGSGEEIWSHTYPCRAGSYPGPLSTPTVEGDAAYTLSKEGHLFCFDAESGAVRWQRHLTDDFGAPAPEWGFSSSVVVSGDVLLVNAFRAGVAIRKDSGDLVWMTEKEPCGYASPVLMDTDAGEHALFFGATALYGVDVATGAQLWSYPWVTAYDVNAADPLVIGENVFISSGYRTGCALIETSNNSPRVLWKNSAFSSHFSSFVYYDGYIYGNDGDANSHRGVFRCVRAADGEEMWSIDEGMGSIIAVDGTIVLLSEKRLVVAVEPDPSGVSEIGRFELPVKGLFWTPPVLSRGRLYLRSMTGELYCLDVG